MWTQSRSLLFAALVVGGTISCASEQDSTEHGSPAIATTESGQARHQFDAKEHADKLQRELSLNEEQRAAAEEIFRSKISHQQMRDDLQKVLTPEQFTQFEALMAKHPQEKRGHFNSTEHAAHMQEALGLQDSQRDQIEAVFVEFQPRKLELHKEFKAFHARENGEPAELEALKTRNAELRKEMADRLQAILTPEQFSKWQELMANHPKHHGHPEGECQCKHGEAKQ